MVYLCDVCTVSLCQPHSSLGVVNQHKSDFMVLFVWFFVHLYVYGHGVCSFDLVFVLFLRDRKNIVGNLGEERL